MNEDITNYTSTHQPARRNSRTGRPPMSPTAMRERQLAINKAMIIPNYGPSTAFPPRPPGQFGSAPVKSRKNRK